MDILATEDLFDLGLPEAESKTYSELQEAIVRGALNMFEKISTRKTSS